MPARVMKPLLSSLIINVHYARLQEMATGALGTNPATLSMDLALFDFMFLSHSIGAPWPRGSHAVEEALYLERQWFSSPRVISITIDQA